MSMTGMNLLGSTVIWTKLCPLKMPVLKPSHSLFSLCQQREKEISGVSSSPDKDISHIGLGRTLITLY